MVCTFAEGQKTNLLEHRSFIKYSWFLVGMVFLVILAGGVVRMTQSGMGCPDWPRCFGLWIPPINESQLPADFEKYLSKQDIDHTFNVYHTWIEYINRLLGAILGLFILINMFLAFKNYRKADKKIVFYSLLLLILVGFQGWLGKLVVDSNLSVVKITIHMLVAILIAIIPLINIAHLKKQRIIVPSVIKHSLTALVIILTLQIIFGTQVREQIDEISKSFAYSQRELWISRLDTMFTIHRSFSWIILLLGLWIFKEGRKVSKFSKHSLYISGTIFLTIFLGITMANFGMPAVSQPLHLLLACGLLVGAFYSRIRVSS